MSDHAPSIDDLLAHGEFLRALARRLVADEATANDVVQDVWVRALQRPPRRRDSLAGWFSRVTRNLVRDRAASEQARGSRERSHGIDRGNPPPGPVGERAAAVEHLGRAFAALPPIYRDALYLRYYEERGPQEIAEQLGLSVATAKTRLRRGLELLRNDLDGRLGSDRNFALALLPFAVAHSKTGGLWMTKKAVAACVIVLVGGGLWLARDAARSVETSARAEQAGQELVPARELGGASVEADAQDPVELEAAREPVVEAAAAPRFTGRVVYASTGQGVPFYRFQASSSASESEWLETAEDGSFSSRVAHAAELEVSLPGAVPPEPLALPDPEDEALAPPREQQGAAIVSAVAPIAGGLSAAMEREALKDVRELVLSSEPAVIEVALGPTYLLDFELPQGHGYAHDDFDATIVGVKYESLRERRALLGVNAEPRPWVRFPQPDKEVFLEPWDWRLELLSHDGRWAGKAVTDWVHGVHEQRVAIELVTHTRLAGVVRDEKGRALDGIGVRLQEEGGERTHYRKTDAAGEYTFELLEPGAYAQYIQDDHFLPWKETVALPGGETLNDVTLTSRPPGGSIAGRITSATGKFTGRVFLFLEGEGDQNVWRRQDPDWKAENGVFVARFAFDDLGHGSYRVVCNTIEGVPIEGRVRSLAPPDTDVHFHIEDDRPVLSLDLEVVDDETGEPVESYHFLSRVENGYMDDNLVSPGQSVERVIREGVDFAWWIRAEGYRAAGGSAADFADGPPTVRLRPGFCAVVHVLSIESLSSLPGVTVFADGVPVSVTDAEGDVVLDLPAKPRTLGFDPERWTIYRDGGFHSDIDPETGTFEVGDDFHLGAYLRRVE